MAKAKYTFTIKYKAYTHNNNRVVQNDYEKTIYKGEEIHNNVAIMLENPSQYDWGMMRGGLIYRATFEVGGGK